MCTFMYLFRLFINYSLNTDTVPLPLPFVLLKENDRSATFRKQTGDGLKMAANYVSSPIRKWRLFLFPWICFTVTASAKRMQQNVRLSPLQTWLLRVLTVSISSLLELSHLGPKTTMWDPKKSHSASAETHVEKPCREGETQPSQCPRWASRSLSNL